MVWVRMEKLELKIKGLYLSPNDYSSVPPGALLEASNGVIDEDSLFESRRGQTFYSTTAFASTVDMLYNYNNTLLVHFGTTMAYDAGAGVFTNYSGTYADPDTDFKVRGIETNQNFYFTTSEGIAKLDSVTGTPTDAGAPPGLDLTCALSGASGFLTDVFGVGYQMLWGYKDANGNLILGAPSQRATIENATGGTRDVSLTFSIPDQITTTWFYQVYRTLMVPNGVTPTNELYLCFEANPTAGEIAAKLVTVIDNTPEALLGATLYTSPTQQGVENANYPPPFAKDIALFNGMTLYANTQNKHRLFLTLAGSGAPALGYVATTGNTNSNTTLNGLGTTTNVRVGMKVRGTGIPATSRVLTVDSAVQVTLTVAATATAVGVTIEFEDILSLSGVEYYASAAESVANREFLAATGGTPAEDIEDTALSIVKVVNQSASTTNIYAYYTSGYNSLPGQMVFEERDVGGATFYATSTNGSSFNPTLPISGTTIYSTNDAKANGIYISKNNQPDAVPLYAFVFAGSANKPIRRILALRDSVFIFKDDGIFRLTGNDFASVVVSLFDSSKKLYAYNSPAVFDNQIFAFFDDGINAISEQGAQLISKPVENVLLEVSQYANFQANTFGVGYDSDRKYMLWTVDTTTDTYAKTAWVWNAITSTWTTWDLPRYAGLVADGDNKLYMSQPVNDFLYVERKSFTYLDYADESYAITITAVNGTVISVASTTNIEVGDAIKQGTRISTVVSIDSLDVTVNYELSYTVGAATVDKPFDVRIAYVPLDADNPSIVKHFPEATYFFKEANFIEILSGFSSNNAGEEQFALPQPSNANGDYGNGIYGTSPFGGLGVTGGRIAIRTYLPLEPSRANWVTASLEVNEPFVNISFLGMAYLYNPCTTKLVV